MESLHWVIISCLCLTVCGKTVHVYRPTHLEEHRLNPTGCGGVLRQRSGTITTPGYPGSYPANAFCFWEIFIPEGDLLTLEFEDFSIEHADAETKYCTSDKVVIIHHTHGEDETKPRYFCGDDAPPKLTYKGYKMVVGFISDGIMERRGFKANYTMFRDPELLVKEDLGDARNIVEPRHVPVYRECGGTVSDIAATIQSPGYPTSYNNDLTCIWQIRTSRQEPIFLMFDDLDLEDSDDCRHDYVDIYDGNNQHLAKFCGTHKPNVVMTSLGRMNIVFRSDGINVQPSSGFSASFGNVLTGHHNSTIILGDVKTGDVIKKKTFIHEDL